MYEVSNITSSPNQSFTIIVNDTIEINFALEYRANQAGWFFSFTYNEQTYSNIRLATSYNIFRGYRSWLPFGLRVDTVDMGEPMDIDDFSTGYATLYILDKQDVITTESKYYNVEVPA